jgi:hypothetical protein
MFFPETASQAGQNPGVVIAFQIVLMAVGIVLTFYAYRFKV